MLIEALERKAKMQKMDFWLPLKVQFSENKSLQSKKSSFITLKTTSKYNDA